MGCSQGGEEVNISGNSPMKLGKYLEKNLCQIKINDNGKYGLGYFCKLKYKNNDIYCLLSNNHVITEEMIDRGYFEVSISNTIKKIDLNKKIFTNDEINYICIEVENYEDIEFLEIDGNCYKDQKKIYDKKEIVNASINQNQEIELKKGNLEYIDENKKFYFNSEGDVGFSEGPIILNSNFKIIGINCGYEEKIKKNIGIYMNDIIKDINKYNIIEGILEINNDLLFRSSSDIKLEEVKLYLNNKKVNIAKKDKNYIFDVNNLENKKYQFKIYFSNIIEHIYFYCCHNFHSVDLTYFDTSNITNMQGMFSSCSELKEIKGLNKFNTSKVTDMSAMFEESNKLISLDLTNFDTSNVTDMENMFNCCNALEEIKGLNKFNTSKVTNIQGMFQGCWKLICLDLSNFDTSNAPSLSFMFNYCVKLKEIKGLNKFKTSKVTNMKYMFQGCRVLISLDLTSFDTSNVTDMRFMFNECHELKEIKGINKFKTSKVTNMKAIFCECHNLLNLDLNFDTSNVTDMEGAFNYCDELKEIKGINKFNTSKVTNMAIMFQFCQNLISLDLNFDTSNVTNMASMFNECHELKEIKGINKFNTSKVTVMNGMFQECNKLTELELINFNTSNVTEMQWMFNRCHSLKEIKGINKFNTNKVTNMHGMFEECFNLLELDLTNFNTSNVTDMNRMFGACYELKEIKGINKFNTSKVIDMGCMFRECRKLINLDLTNFDTSNVINMQYMFCDCSSLKNLTINFILNDFCNLNYMFKGLNSSCAIKTKNEYLKQLFGN